MGPTEELKKFGIEPVLVNENIGRNMNDHNVFSIMATVPNDYEFSTSTMSNNLQNIQQAQEDFFERLSGPYTAPSGVTNGFQKMPNEELESIGAQEIISRGLVNRSHIEYLYESVWYPWIPTPYYVPRINESYISLTASSLVALSRGNLSLRSSSMSDSPVINPNVSLFLHCIYTARQLTLNSTTPTPPIASSLFTPSSTCAVSSRTPSLPNTPLAPTTAK